MQSPYFQGAPPALDHKVGDGMSAIPCAYNWLCATPVNSTSRNAASVASLGTWEHGTSKSLLHRFACGVSVSQPPRNESQCVPAALLRKRPVSFLRLPPTRPGIDCTDSQRGPPPRESTGTLAFLSQCSNVARAAGRTTPKCTMHSRLHMHPLASDSVRQPMIPRLRMRGWGSMKHRPTIEAHSRPVCRAAAAMSR